MMNCNHGDTDEVVILKQIDTPTVRLLSFCFNRKL